MTKKKIVKDVESTEKVEPKKAYVFKRALKDGTTVYRQGQLAYLTDCEAYKLSQYLVGYEKTNCDCGCK